MRVLAAGAALGLLLATDGAAAEGLRVAGDGPTRSLEPVCVAVNGLDCRTVVAIDLGLGAALAVHDGAADVAARGFGSLGLRTEVAGGWRLGALVDVGFETSGNQERDRALGWFVAPKASALRVLSEDWAIALGAGASFVRTSHDLGADARVGALAEGGIAFGEVTVTLAPEVLLDPSGTRGVEARTYLLLRASACGWLAALSYGAVDC